MKNIFCTLLFALAFAACKQEKQGIQLEKTFLGPMDTGYLEANRDGDFWQSTAYAQYSVFDSLHVGIICFTFSEEGFYREQLNLGKIPFKIGKYLIKGNNAISTGLDGFVGGQYSWSEADGDIFGAAYNHDDETSSGTLEVTLVDTASKRIVGNFNNLVFKNVLTKSPYPERVFFENGKFDMKITE